MKIAERVNLDAANLKEDLPYLSQLGVTHLGIMIRSWEPRFGEDERWYVSPGSNLRLTEYYHLEDLLAMKEWAASYGLTLYSIMDTRFVSGNRKQMGEASYVKHIDNIKKSIINMGKAGIEQFTFGSVGPAGIQAKSPFGLHVWRTSEEKVGRGGATVYRFDYEKAKQVPVSEMGVISEEEIWNTTEEFLKEICPVAEEAGVQLCFHPADPPVPSLRGVAKILKNAEDYDRLLNLVPEKCNKMIFCLGCFAQMMEAEKVYDAIRHFGKDHIAEVHFRNVQGTLDNFLEVYPDEGVLDMVKVIEVLKEIGYDGPVVVDHTPHGVGDTAYGHRGRAFAFGYLRGILQAESVLG